ncbi:hypothetical protein KIPB_005800 [Kipferlia bialata]|uniref:CBS domain-containing protein n=1 Tax=Kipferlia bialata TaxID=797122 RepID=A0A9K3GIJ2_9EUKA|nr:hypothetical protein KIPB_005800 [Kipferlia bialata]|eukprot:g5800.t1
MATPLVSPDVGTGVGTEGGVAEVSANAPGAQTHENGSDTVPVTETETETETGTSSGTSSDTPDSTEGERAEGLPSDMSGLGTAIPGTDTVTEVMPPPSPKVSRKSTPTQKEAETETESEREGGTSAPTPSLPLPVVPQMGSVSEALDRAGDEEEEEPVVRPVLEVQDVHTIADFLRSYSVAELMPESAKVVVIQDTMSLYRAWRVMAENRVTSALLWDPSPDAERYTGILTASDLMTAALCVHEEYFTQQATEASHAELASFPSLGYAPSFRTVLRQVSIKSWKGAGTQGSTFYHRRPFMFATPTHSVFSAVRYLFRNDIHRLPVLNLQGSVTHSITYWTVCRFLVNLFRLPADVLDKRVLQLGIGDRNIVTVRWTDPLKTVLEVLLRNRLSAVPVVDDQCHVVDIFSKADFAQLALFQSIDSLDMTLSESLKLRPQYVEPATIVDPDITLGKVLTLIASKAGIHRVVLSRDGDIHAVVSLRHILAFLVGALEANSDI